MQKKGGYIEGDYLLFLEKEWKRRFRNSHKRIQAEEGKEWKKLFGNSQKHNVTWTTNIHGRLEQVKWLPTLK